MVHFVFTTGIHKGDWRLTKDIPKPTCIEYLVIGLRALLLMYTSCNPIAQRCFTRGENIDNELEMYQQGTRRESCDKKAWKV